MTQHTTHTKIMQENQENDPHLQSILNKYNITIDENLNIYKNKTLFPKLLEKANDNLNKSYQSLTKLLNKK
jgi:hypothetical protein